MPLTPLERKAAFAHAAMLKEQTRVAAAKELGVSWTHLNYVLGGERDGSDELEDKVAAYCGQTVRQFWGARKAKAVA
jgi:hypothetical protein